MDGLGQQLFACPALAFNQNSNIGLSDFINNRLDFIHLRTVRENDLGNIVHRNQRERANYVPISDNLLLIIQPIET
jgi:hypothetical protein